MHPSSLLLSGQGQDLGWDLGMETENQESNNLKTPRKLTGWQPDCKALPTVNGSNCWEHHMDHHKPAPEELTAN